MEPRTPAVMVLAAGLGTRLRPLTDALPKPLCPVGDRPQIEHVFAHLVEAGVRRAVVNTHHLAHHFTAAWVARQPLEVTLVHEPSILGTGGGLANAASALGPGPCLVWNADILARPPLRALFGAPLAFATLVVGPRLPPGEGTLGLAEDGTVARVRTGRRGREHASADYAGIALLSEDLRARLRAPSCLVGDVLVPAVEAGEAVATHTLATPFADTGSLRAYLDANLAWLEGASFVHSRGEVSTQVSLVRSIVGESARVIGDGALVDTVVWPGAEARAPLTSAIVTPAGVVCV